MLGHMQIIVNGAIIMEFPVSDSMGCTRPNGGMFGMIPFYDGLNFGAGATIEARIDPSVSVNQKFHLFTAGEENAVGGAEESKFKRWTGSEWKSIGTLTVYKDI
jgi:hypothetical protein